MEKNRGNTLISTIKDVYKGLLVGYCQQEGCLVTLVSQYPDEILYLEGAYLTVSV